MEHPFRAHWKKVVIPAMRAKFGYANTMAIPRLEKIVVNCGVGKIREEKDREEVQKFLRLITGQKPAPRPAKKAIASFKTRKGFIIGYQVTLRGTRMYDFLTRLVRIALPRTRDFRGIDSQSIDANGNLTIGIKEHTVFPEMIGEDYRFLFGFEVTIVTTAKKRNEAVELFKLLGFPIRSR